MLIVSRVINGTTVGILDTDDGVETLVSRGELDDIVFKHGLHIAGVGVGVEMSFFGAQSDYIADIEVQQDMSQVTSFQAKMKTMVGVDIRVFNDEITAIFLDEDVIRSNTVIRLSDFGHKMNWGLQVRWRKEYHDKFVTLKYDDKLELDGKPIINRFHTITDLTDLSDADAIYREYLRIPATTWRIVDKPERLFFWFSVAYFTMSDRTRNSVSSHASRIPTGEEMYRNTAEVFREDFKQLAASDAWHVTGENHKAMHTHCRNLIDKHQFPFTVEDSYDYLVEKAEGIFTNISKLRGKKHSSILSILRRYVTTFIVDDIEVREAYVKLCNCYVQSIMRYYAKHKIDF